MAFSIQYTKHNDRPARPCDARRSGTTENQGPSLEEGASPCATPRPPSAAARATCTSSSNVALPAVLNYTDSGKARRTARLRRRTNSATRRRRSAGRRSVVAAMPRRRSRANRSRRSPRWRSTPRPAPAAAGEDYAEETARWYIPENMIRHEGGGDPGSIRILRARGDSMEPGIFDGDRMLVDVSRRNPATGETAVLWDGAGLVVKKVEIVPHAEAPRLRLLSANPDYEPYECLAAEAHVVGTVLWSFAAHVRRGVSRSGSASRSSRRWSGKGADSPTDDREPDPPSASTASRIAQVSGRGPGHLAGPRRHDGQRYLRVPQAPRLASKSWNASARSSSVSGQMHEARPRSS